MRKTILYLLFILFVKSSLAQLKLDSIFSRIDTISNFEKKLAKLERLSIKNRLTNRDLSTIQNKIDNYSSLMPISRDKLLCIRYKGNILWYQQKYNDALAEYFKLLEMAESLKDTMMIGQSNQDIAETYDALENINLAVKHFYYALKSIESSNSDLQLSNIYNALGNCYKGIEKNDSALKYHQKSLVIKLKLNDKSGVSHCYNNIGLVYKNMHDYKKAEIYFLKSLQLKRDLNETKGIAGSLINLGNIYMLQKKNKIAEDYFIEGIHLAHEAKSGNFLKNGIEALAKNYFELKQYKESAVWFNRFKGINDSLKEEASSKQLAELSARYEADKKDTEISLKEEQLKFSNAENSKQRILIFASGIALLTSFIAIFFIYRSFKLNKRNAKILSEKNHLIAEKNKEITDSINYAKLIQQSLLASSEMLDKNLQEYFVFYQPKDIVSGDFYWGAEINDEFVLACVDCTGHGVPGAFMSLIGKENLDKAISKYCNPGEILAELNRNVKRSLNQSVNGGKDGMDSALISLKKGLNGNFIRYSGANRPMWVIAHNNSVLTELKATKHAIGGLTDDEQIFEEHSLQLQRGDMIYISTDGFADQFGSDKNKKLTTKRFKEILISLHKMEVSEQKSELKKIFEEWKGTNEQLDDLLVIGIRI